MTTLPLVMLAIVPTVVSGPRAAMFSFGATSAGCRNATDRSPSRGLTGLDEQQEIVRRIDSVFAWIDRLATEAASVRALVDHLDQAVLAKAFRGALVPQDPADEPASVLLGRIRDERAAAPPAKTRGRRAKAAA